MAVTKAIVPVAGWGTRRLPVTKAVEKCMLPIGNRPVIDYVVQDCIAAGITDIYFVVGEQSTQLHDFYRNNVELNDYLRRNGKEDLLAMIQPPKVRLHYVVQSSYGKYGTAVPVSLAYEAMGSPDEPILVVGGDDCLFCRDRRSDIARLIEAACSGSAMLGVTIPREKVQQYGVIETNEHHEFVRIVEKPTPETAPSTMINVSKYVLSPEILREAIHYVSVPKSGEYYITDPINTAVHNGESCRVIEAEGVYLDAGTLENWLAANEYIIQNM